MRLKYKLLLLHIFIISLTLLFIILIYDSYKLNQNNTYQNQIQQIVTINKEFMNSNLQHIKQEVQKIQSLFLAMENELNQSSIDNNTSMLKLKDKLSQLLNLNNKSLSLEVFILNKDYKIIRSSNTFDLNYNISTNKNEKNTLEKINKLGRLTQSSGVFFDAFDQTIKKYAFLKLNNSTYLGISIIFKFSKKQQEAFKNLVLALHTKLNYRYVIKDTNNFNYTMNFTMSKDNFSTRAKYYEEVYKKRNNAVKDLPFIKASQQGTEYSIKKDNILYTYIPLLKKDNTLLPLFADIVLEIQSNTSSEKIFFHKTYYHVIYFIIMHILMVLIIFYFTTSYHNLEKTLKKAVLKNLELVKYNKNFIANMVHQIRTPLSVIMSNLSLIEYFSKDNNKYSHQINASITTLSNSYENLSYINSYDSLLYKSKKINLSDFLKLRVAYFDNAASANQMNLITNINDNIFFTINDIELERIFDNTITNAIKYSSFKEDIYITLKKNPTSTVIIFKSRGPVMENEKLIFQKKRRKKNQKHLYLGLYVVNLIAKKYDIKVGYKRDGDFNIFEYHFQNID